MKETRNTIQKALVLNAVNEMKNHPTAEEVFHYIQKAYSHISKTTVYNNLQLLASKGQLRRLEMPNGSTRYDHRFHDNYHFLCKECHRLFDSDIEEEKALIKEIKEKSDYQIDDVNIVLTGTCPDCIKKIKEIKQ
ncbi:MAG TPA: transcriptional repressor [Candidatus Onthovivens sp.]|nr:transcriptional repressor [Candidatus Onthovivens sp.]